MSPSNAPLSARLQHRLKPIFQLTEEQALARETVLHKLHSGEYPVEHVECVVCGSAPFDVIAEREQYGLPYRVAMCQRCGLLWTTPRMTVGATGRFYSDEFRRLHGGTDEQSLASTYAKKLLLAEAVFAYIRDLLPSTGTVVEIGCGTGANLRPFQDNGFEVAGCDYDSRYLEYGSSQGIRGLVAGGSEALIGRYEGSATLVILSHVLEHFTDIPGELASARRLLRPGGYLFVAVPGVRDVRASKCLGNLLAFLIVSHNYHFSLRTLTNVMSHFSFARVRGDETIMAVFETAGPLKLSSIESAYERDLAFLQQLERRWTTWTLPERFVWERRHLGLRRRAVRVMEALGVRRRSS